MPKDTSVKKVEEPLGGSGIAYVPRDAEADERNLADELFGKKDVKEIIDNFELAKGIIKKKTKVQATRKKSILLDLSKVKDRGLLEDLMNEPQYGIVEFTKFFSSTTNKLTAFIVYTEKKIEDNKQQ